VIRIGLVAVVVCVVVCGTIGCAREDQLQPSAEVAFKDMQVVLDESEAPEEKVPILEAFIAAYPDTEQSENALGDVIYYRTREMDDLPGALAITRTALEQTSDPELRFKIGLRLHDLSAQAGEPTDLGAVADELAAHRELGFVDHLDVVEAAEKSASWELMLEHADAMADFANEAAFRAAYPDEDFTDERVAFSVNRRRAWVLAYQGGALTHLGRLAEAEEVFALADDLPASTDFLGISETPIDIYRGEAALLAGQPEQAAELFAHDALMGGKPTAIDGMKEAYACINGGAEGFDDYALAIRQRIARPLPDVTLADYTGETVSLSAMAGKVMVISFWNPG
jgi:hypothetical protein